MAIFHETKGSSVLYPEDKTDIDQTPGESKASSW